MFQANERKGIERRRCDQTRSFKMEMGSDLLSLTNPVLYAGSALVIALVALGAMVFTLIRQRRLLDAKLKSTNKTLKQQTEKSSASASSNTEKTEDQPKAQEKNYDAALTGKWPATLDQESTTGNDTRVDDLFGNVDDIASEIESSSGEEEEMTEEERIYKADLFAKFKDAEDRLKQREAMRDQIAETLKNFPTKEDDEDDDEDEDEDEEDEIDDEDELGPYGDGRYMARKEPKGEGEDALRDLVKDMEVDPVEFCEHIPGKVKQVKAKVAQKKIEEQMSEEQKESERDVQREQLESIFKLLKEQEDKFGIKSMDDMEQQMSMYVTK